jgi:Mor family transcriptional regulator
VIGLQSTIDLVSVFAGDEPKIPKKVDGHSRIWSALVDAVGHEAAAKLVDRYADTTLYVPFCKQALRKVRDLDIVRSLDAGEHFDSVRRRHKISRSYLYRLAKKPL